MHLGLFFFWAWRTGFFTQNSQLTSAHQQARTSGSLWAQASPGLFPGPPSPLALFPSGRACDPWGSLPQMGWKFPSQEFFGPLPSPQQIIPL